jgi:hypothetical protein
MQEGIVTPDSAVLAVVVDLGAATPGAVAEALGCGEGEASDRLDALVDGGWLVFWPQAEVGDPPRVTLTPWGAERLGVRLDHRSERWVPVTEGPPALRVPAKRETIQESVFNEVRWHWRSALEVMVDPCQDEPWVAVAQAEAIDRALASGVYGGDYGPERLPFPAMFLGLSNPWDGPKPARGRRRLCRACGGRPLPPHVYCLRCDNWGFDDAHSNPVRRARRRGRRAKARPVT